MGVATRIWAERGMERRDDLLECEHTHITRSRGPFSIQKMARKIFHQRGREGAGRRRRPRPFDNHERREIHEKEKNNSTRLIWIQGCIEKYR